MQQTLATNFLTWSSEISLQAMETPKYQTKTDQRAGGEATHAKSPTKGFFQDELCPRGVDSLLAYTVLISI